MQNNIPKLTDEAVGGAIIELMRHMYRIGGAVDQWDELLYAIYDENLFVYKRFQTAAIKAYPLLWEFIYTKPGEPIPRDMLRLLFDIHEFWACPIERLGEKYDAARIVAANMLRRIDDTLTDEDREATMTDGKTQLILRKHLTADTLPVLIDDKIIDILTSTFDLTELLQAMKDTEKARY